MTENPDRSSSRLLMFTPRQDSLPRPLLASRQPLTFPAAPRRVPFSVRFSETLRRLLESEREAAQ